VSSTDKDRPRRQKGEGTIVKLADGRVARLFPLPKDPKSGKRRRRWISAKNTKELNRKVADAKARGGGDVKATVKGTVGEWIEQWLEEIKTQVRQGRKRPIGENSWILYESSWRLHAKDALGAIPLETFDIEHVETLYGLMKKAGASANVQNRVGRVLHTAFVAAIKKRKYTRPNPFAIVDRAFHEVEERPMLEPEQAQALMKAAGADRFEALWVLLLTGGLRLGEALALEWSDIDLKAKTVSIRRALHEVRGKAVFGPTKTPKSRRQVTLGALAIAALKRRQKAAEKEEHDATLVFPTKIGTPMRRGNLLRTHFRPLCEAAKITGFRMHDLRHASASFALLSGAPAKAVAERLGHSTTRLTLDRYSHVLAELQKGTADGIDRVLRKKPAKKKSK
jgi:integrase